MSKQESFETLPQPTPTNPKRKKNGRNLIINYAWSVLFALISAVRTSHSVQKYEFIYVKQCTTQIPS